MSIKISSQFDAGAIDVVSATSADAIDLNIRKDSHADITQWFYFRLQGAQGQPCTLRFLNAGKSADIIAVASSPLADIAQLKKVGFVMKEGQVIRDARL